MQVSQAKSFGSIPDTANKNDKGPERWYSHLAYNKPSLSHWCHIWFPEHTLGSLLNTKPEKVH